MKKIIAGISLLILTVAGLAIAFHHTGSRVEDAVVNHAGKCSRMLRRCLPFQRSRV